MIITILQSQIKKRMKSDIIYLLKKFYFTIYNSDEGIKTEPDEASGSVNLQKTQRSEEHFELIHESKFSQVQVK